MSCTPLTGPLRHLPNLADTTGAPSDSLNPEGLAQARRFGSVYEHQGRVALTGAGGGSPRGDQRWDDGRVASVGSAS
jgi:hypothetical protein